MADVFREEVRRAETLRTRQHQSFERVLNGENEQTVERYREGFRSRDDEYARERRDVELVLVEMFIPEVGVAV